MSSSQAMAATANRGASPSPNGEAPSPTSEAFKEKGSAAPEGKLDDKPANEKLANGNGLQHPAGSGSPFAEAVALSSALDAAFAGWQRRGLIGVSVAVGDWAATLAAVAAAPRPEELIFPSAGEARLALFRGLPLEDLLSQHLGLDSPSSDPATSQAGHAIPGTLADAAHRVVAPGGSVGAHLLHAVGAALAAKTLKRDEAVLAVAPAEAADTDDCHAALNFAAVYRAPVVFVFRAALAGDNTAAALMERARGYALAAVLAEAEAPDALQAELTARLAEARAGRGPALVVVAPPASGAAPTAADDRSPAIAAALLSAAAARCEAAFAAARFGRRPAQFTRGVFAQPTWPLRDQARDLAGEPWAPPEEV